MMRDRERYEELKRKLDLLPDVEHVTSLVQEASLALLGGCESGCYFNLSGSFTPLCLMRRLEVTCETSYCSVSHNSNIGVNCCETTRDNIISS